MRVTPLHDRVLVKRVASEEKIGGIFIPDSAKEKPVHGLVVSVGAGKMLDNGDVRAMSVKAGDKILFSKYAGTEIKIGQDDHTIMREDDVLGIIED